MKNLFLELGFEDGDKQMAYSKESIYVSRIFSKYISDLKIKNLRKIYIGIVTTPNEYRVIPTHELTKVCLIYKYLDWQNYENINLESNRYKIFLDFILVTLLEVSDKFDWPKEYFEKAYAEVIKSKFKNIITLLPSKFSKDKKHSASVIVNCDKDVSSITIELQSIQERDLKRFELINITSLVDNFSRVVHRIKWISNEELIISNKEDEINFKFSIPNGLAEIFLTPRTHDEKYLQDELTLLNPRTSQAKCLEIYDKRIANLTRPS